MNWVKLFLETLWGLFAWLSFGLAVFFSLIVVLIVPTPKWRQKLVTWASKMVFVLPLVDVRVSGMDDLPPDDCVVVANHASYLDGPLLKGYLPWRFNFVIKGEMRNFGPAHFLLRRSGSGPTSMAAHGMRARSSRPRWLANRWASSRRVRSRRSPG